jgi:hypothetical protein
MTFTPEEILAHREKSMMIRRLPLEQAVQYVNGPVYGPVKELEELFGLPVCTNTWHSESRMSLYLWSPTEPHHARAFFIDTSLYAEGRPLMRIPSTSCSLTAARGSLLCCDISLSQYFKGSDAVFIIEGKIFKGWISHRADPMLYSRVHIQHERVVIYAEALGPSIEEFIQIVESLHDLNGKAVE